MDLGSFQFFTKIAKNIITGIPAQFIGNKLLDNQGYMYRKDKIRHGAGSVTWRCSVEQKFKCKSRAKTIGAYIVKQTYPHNHQPKFP